MRRDARTGESSIKSAATQDEKEETKSILKQADEMNKEEFTEYEAKINN